MAHNLHMIHIRPQGYLKKPKGDIPIKFKVALLNATARSTGVTLHTNVPNSDDSYLSSAGIIAFPKKIPHCEVKSIAPTPDTTAYENFLRHLIDVFSDITGRNRVIASVDLYKAIALKNGGVYTEPRILKNGDYDSLIETIIEHTKNPERKKGLIELYNILKNTKETLDQEIYQTGNLSEDTSLLNITKEFIKMKKGIISNLNAELKIFKKILKILPNSKIKSLEDITFKKNTIISQNQVPIIDSNKIIEERFNSGSFAIIKDKNAGKRLMEYIATIEALFFQKKFDEAKYNCRDVISELIHKMLRKKTSEIIKYTLKGADDSLLQKDRIETNPENIKNITAHISGRVFGIHAIGDMYEGIKKDSAEYHAQMKINAELSSVFYPNKKTPLKIVSKAKWSQEKPSLHTQDTLSLKSGI